jgi:hypothetical protein
VNAKLASPHLIAPVITALGWNIDDPASYSRQRYCRGAGIADAVLLQSGSPVCYVEVKRLGGVAPLGLLRNERRYYTEEEEQALRYARRNVELPAGQRWTILTNFERLYLFEATTDERIMVFEDPEELIERFDDDTRYLTRREMLSGGLLRWAHRRDRPDVDAEFRDTLNRWRLELAQDIYNRNKTTVLLRPDEEVNIDGLQQAVQRLLDRLVVLQFATDLEALEGEPLRELLRRTAPSASALVRTLSLQDELSATFRLFDDLYNTSIFAPGHICERVEVGNEVLRRVVFQVASQNFRRFTSDILGATYESYLGKQLQIDEDGQMRLVTRPELRKQGGVYYTPTDVVQHIVSWTLDPLLQAGTFDTVSKLTILDQHAARDRSW